jgi:hypothetical protein
LIAEYVNRNFNFLIGLGITPPDLTTVAEIGKAHRKVNLDALSGLEQRLGAVMRVIDELDVGPNRAPAHVLENISDEMDNVSRWHWFKHNVTLDWDLGHNVESVTTSRTRSIQFSIAVRPTSRDTIPYWLTQVYRPIKKALVDEAAAKIIADHYKVHIDVRRSPDLSRESGLKGWWADLEQQTLSQGRKVILIVDDEVSKYDDVFYPLMERYRVVKAPDARAALTYLTAMHISVAVLDLQMGSQGLWNEGETSDFKLTGLNLAREIREKFPEVRVGILTGTRHRIPELEDLKLDFFLRKPIMPLELCETIEREAER